MYTGFISVCTVPLEWVPYMHTRFVQLLSTSRELHIMSFDAPFSHLPPVIMSVWNRCQRTHVPLCMYAWNWHVVLQRGSNLIPTQFFFFLSISVQQHIYLFVHLIVFVFVFLKMGHRFLDIE